MSHHRGTTGTSMGRIVHTRKRRKASKPPIAETREEHEARMAKEAEHHGAARVHNGTNKRGLKHAPRKQW